MYMSVFQGYHMKTQKDAIKKTKQFYILHRLLFQLQLMFIITLFGRIIEHFLIATIAI